MCISNCCEGKIIITSQRGHVFKNLLTFTPLRNSCLITFKKCRRVPRRSSLKKSVLKHFAIFTGKFSQYHLCWRLFLTQNIAKSKQITYFEEHLQTTASENVHETENS